VSRLARNNADWHRLLEICALAGTLICDEDGLYDPADFNDRLLLGLSDALCRARHSASKVTVTAARSRSASMGANAVVSLDLASTSTWSIRCPPS
jgi:DNA invertase Pin-like site-specific DNA recombinase